MKLNAICIQLHVLHLKGMRIVILHVNILGVILQMPQIKMINGLGRLITIIQWLRTFLQQKSICFMQQITSFDQKFKNKCSTWWNISKYFIKNIFFCPFLSILAHFCSFVPIFPHFFFCFFENFRSAFCNTAFSEKHQNVA